MRYYLAQVHRGSEDLDPGCYIIDAHNRDEAVEKLQKKGIQAATVTQMTYPTGKLMQGVRVTFSLV